MTYDEMMSLSEEQLEAQVKYKHKLTNNNQTHLFSDTRASLEFRDQFGNMNGKAGML